MTIQSHAGRCLQERVHATRIIRLVKALGGEVFGETAREELFSTKEMTRIYCRFQNPRDSTNFRRVLKVDFGVVDIESDRLVEKTFDVYNSLDSLDSLDKIRVIVDDNLRKMWRMERPDFDIDALSSDSTSIYFYPIPTINDPVDPCREIVKKIIQRRFELHPTIQKRTLEKTVSVMRKAIDLVEKGWVMSSIPTSWNVARCVPMSTNDKECAICQCRFNFAEVTTRLTCCHVFHAKCIIKWMETKNNCPCCRAEV